MFFLITFFFWKIRFLNKNLKIHIFILINMKCDQLDHNAYDFLIFDYLVFSFIFLKGISYIFLIEKTLIISIKKK